MTPITSFNSFSFLPATSAPKAQPAPISAPSVETNGSIASSSSSSTGFNAIA